MCNCIKETINAAQEKLVAQVEEKHTVSEWIDKGSYSHQGLSLSGGPSKIGMPFIIQYRRQKVNGQPEKNITTEHITMYPTYCPFCGKKY